MYSHNYLSRETNAPSLDQEISRKHRMSYPFANSMKVHSRHPILPKSETPGSSSTAPSAIRGQLSFKLWPRIICSSPYRMRCSSHELSNFSVYWQVAQTRGRNSRLPISVLTPMPALALVLRGKL